MHLGRSARRLAYLVSLVLPLMLTVACSGGGGGGGGAITVRMTEFKFEPATFTATAGQPVRLNLQNEGTVVHDFMIKDLNVHSPKVQPGKSMPFEFTPARAGTFEIMCEEPGHEPGGMKGTITVQ